MARILTFSSRQRRPKDSLGDKLHGLWDSFLSLDFFTRTAVIIGLLIAITVPVIVGEQTGFFSHAASGIFSNCIVPPPNFSQQDLQLLSQTRKVNWCNTLAQNTTVATTAQQDVAQAGQSGSDATTGFFSPIIQFLLKIRLLFIGH